MFKFWNLITVNLCYYGSPFVYANEAHKEICATFINFLNRMLFLRIDVFLGPEQVVTKVLCRAESLPVLLCQKTNQAWSFYFTPAQLNRCHDVTCGGLVDGFQLCKYNPGYTNDGVNWSNKRKILFTNYV